MANRQHLAMLRKGAERWNRWREENPHVIPDLSRATLGLNPVKAGLAVASRLFLFSVLGVGATALFTDSLKDSHNVVLLTMASFIGGFGLRGLLYMAKGTKYYFGVAAIAIVFLGASAVLLYVVAIRTASVWLAVSIMLSGISVGFLSTVVQVGRRDLAGYNLSGVNLHGAYLEAVNFIATDLSRADLRDSKLTMAAFSTLDGHASDLSGADLRGISYKPTNATAGYFELAGARGLADAITDDGFLDAYFQMVFERIHSLSPLAARLYPGSLSAALRNIRAFREIMQARDEEPPAQLIAVVTEITARLIEYLRHHPRALYSLRPRQFEELVAEILASYGWDVHLTPPSRDGGYDIFAISRDVSGVESSWIIECKKYAEHRKIGVDIVRALYGTTAVLQHGANALLATTSYFTKGAKEFKASRYNLELKDYDAVLQWVNEYRPNPNGKLFLRNNRLVVPGDEGFSPPKGL